MSILLLRLPQHIQRSTSCPEEASSRLPQECDNAELLHQSETPEPEPTLVILPDGSVRIYPHEASLLSAADVTRDYPGHSLAMHCRGSQRPPLPPSFPLRQGGTYYLVSSPGKSTKRLSLDIPRPMHQSPSAANYSTHSSISPGPRDIASRVLSAPASGGHWRDAYPAGVTPASAVLAEAQLRFASLSLTSPCTPASLASPYTPSSRTSSPSPQALRRPALSFPGNVENYERTVVCPYCVAHPSLAMSASWQLCATHGGQRRPMRSISQHSHNELPGYHHELSGEPSEWVDCTYTYNSGPLLTLPLPEEGERMPKSASSKPVGGFNAILEELQQLEEVDEKPEKIEDLKGDTTKGLKARRASKAFGKLMDGVKSIGLKKSGKVLFGREQKVEGGDQATWNALPARFTAT